MTAATGPRARWRPLLLALLLPAVLALAACGGPAFDSESADGGASAPAAGFEEAQDSAGAGAPRREQPAPAPDTKREVVTTAWIRLEVEDPRVRAAEVVAIVGAAGGRVDQRSEQPGTGDTDSAAQLTVRVPADALQGVLDKIEGLGTVEDLTMDATDVTTQAIDLDARIRSLQTSVERLLEIIAQTQNAEDLINAENALAQRQADLESYTSQRASLTEQVALSTVTVYLSQAPQGQTPASGFVGGLQRGWESLLAALQAGVVALGVTLPWLAFLALLALAVVLLVRAVKGRKTPTSVTKPSSREHS